MLSQAISIVNANARGNFPLIRTRAARDPIASLFGSSNHLWRCRQCAFTVRQRKIITEPLPASLRPPG